MASSLYILARSIWYLKSGPLSITMLAFSVSIHTDVRNRLSRLFVEVHTGHGQPIKGMPCDVPVPRKVTFTVTGPFEFEQTDRNQGFLLSAAYTISAFRRSAHFRLRLYWVISPATHLYGPLR